MPRVRSDVSDRQTSVRRWTKASPNASALWGRGIVGEIVHRFKIKMKSKTKLNLHSEVL